MLLLFQADKVFQGTAKHTHHIMLRGGVGIGVGGLEDIGMPLVDFAEELRALTRSTTLVLYRWPA